MSTLERRFVIWTLLYLAAYGVAFLGFGVTALVTRDPMTWLNGYLHVVLPLHLLGMLQNFVALILTIRDLYLRPFPEPNDKLTWSLLIFWTGGIGWLVYVFQHALHPRPEVT